VLLLAACGGGGKKTAATTTTTTTSSSSSSSSSETASTPSGFISIAAPSDADATLFGQNVSVASTKDDRPVVAFSIRDANDELSKIVTTTFDAKTNKFGDLVTVATAKLNDEDHSVSLSSDPASGALVLVWDDSTSTIMGGQSSDEGATWRTAPLVKGDNVHSPSVAVSNGKVIIAFDGGPGDVSIATGDLTSNADFTVEAAPQPADGSGIRGEPPTVRAASDGTFGVTYEVSPPAGGAAIAFLKVGGHAAAPVIAVDSNGVQNDDPIGSLAFSGTNPVVSATLCRTEGEEDACTLYAASSDGGLTFGAPVVVPSDKGEGPGLNMSSAADDQGNRAIAYNPNSGSGIAECGVPKLALSQDAGATWTICGPASPDPDGTLAFAAGRPSLSVSPGRDLFLAFQQTSGTGQAPVGVLVKVYPPPS
jgi:hypothetical protein